MDKNQKTPQKPTVRMETNDTSGQLKTMKKESSTMGTIGLIVAVAVVVLAGVSTGYALAQNKDGLKAVTTGGGVLSDSKVDSSAGELEEGVEYDEAEGKLVPGGIGVEGSHHLERPGGESQNVYLTSSSVDLSAYEGKEVKIWGVTFDAQKAGWLMDVAKLEVK